jgi:predicted MFS family arabinose efflux permease
MLVMAGTVSGYAWIATAIFLSGCAFSAIYGIGTTLLSDTSQPARWYGLKIASEASVGAILLLILPGVVISRWGFEGMMIALAAVVLLLGVLLVRLPASGAVSKAAGAIEKFAPMPSRLRLAVWLSLLSATVFFFCITMIWAFVERMANDAGFDPVATGHVLSLSLAFAVAGSLLAMWQGERLGSGRLFASACVGILIALLMFGQVSSLTDYAVAVCLFSVSFGAGVPSVVTIVAQLDADGRFVVLSVPAIGVGVMTAPAVGGLLTDTIGFEAILWAGGVSAVVATLLSMAALVSGLPALRKLRDARERDISGPML